MITRLENPIVSHGAEASASSIVLSNPIVRINEIVTESLEHVDGYTLQLRDDQKLTVEGIRSHDVSQIRFDHGYRVQTSTSEVTEVTDFIEKSNKVSRNLQNLTRGSPLFVLKSLADIAADWEGFCTVVGHHNRAFKRASGLEVFKRAELGADVGPFDSLFHCNDDLTFTSESNLMILYNILRPGTRDLTHHAVSIYDSEWRIEPRLLWDMHAQMQGILKLPAATLCFTQSTNIPLIPKSYARHLSKSTVIATRTHTDGVITVQYNDNTIQKIAPNEISIQTNRPLNEYLSSVRETQFKTITLGEKKPEMLLTHIIGKQQIRRTIGGDITIHADTAVLYDPADFERSDGSQFSGLQDRYMERLWDVRLTLHPIDDYRTISEVLREPLLETPRLQFAYSGNLEVPKLSVPVQFQQAFAPYFRNTIPKPDIFYK
jgi:hypothetical protein